MNKPIYVGLATGKTLRLVIAVIPLVLAGRAFNANAQTETNLHSFTGGSDGYWSQAKMVQGSDGNFYGTTYVAGMGGGGTVFRISPSGIITTVYSFASYPNDGGLPLGGLIQGSDGNFYGTTYIGGITNFGTVFRISPSGSETNLHSFLGNPDGGNPWDVGLVQGKDGNFYGTTYAGGTSTNCPGWIPSGCGTVFRISPSGTYTTLYSFGSSPSDGLNPKAGLVQGVDGNFYGTATLGGTSSHGTVFRISSSGTYTTLYSFAGYPIDGSDPEGMLVQGSDGNFYGTTSSGGTNTCCGGSGFGTVFRISPSGAYTNLYSFFSGADKYAAHPFAGLVQGSDGNFYGTTVYGCSNNCPSGCGCVFRLSPSGREETLYLFGGSPKDGAYPIGGLIQGSDGNLYGETYQGGTTNNYGTVYRVSVPLNSPPYPINQITGVQLSGTNLVVSIPSIAYETYQLQFSSSMNRDQLGQRPRIGHQQHRGSPDLDQFRRGIIARVLSVRHYAVRGRNWRRELAARCGGADESGGSHPPLVDWLSALVRFMCFPNQLQRLPIGQRMPLFRKSFKTDTNPFDFFVRH
jgi:uncharacterized repeat protein (TIGR03803 family)